MFQDAMVVAAQQPAGVPPYEPRWGSVAELVQERAKEVEAPFLIAYDAGGGRLEFTGHAFAERVRRFAGYLLRRGLRKGDRMATILHNHHEAVFLMFAAWHIGVALVPINMEEPAERKRFILQNSHARMLFTLPEYSGEVLPHLAELPDLMAVVAVGEPGATGLRDLAGELDAAGLSEAPSRADLEDEALIVYTSGTTGNPKGVVLNQYNLLADADAIAGWFGIQPGERWMCVLPIHHVNGIIVTLLSPLYAGGSVVLNRRFSTSTFWQRAAHEGVAVCSMVPTLLEFLLEAGRQGDLPPHRMRGVICGAGPLLPDTVLRFEERFGLPVWHGYGLSETTAYACMTPLDLPDIVRRDWYRSHGFPTIGAAMPHQALSIRNPSGEELPPGERGEICLCGSTIMQGYYQRPDATADAFRFPGWFRSGDEGFWQPGPGGRRFFFITGRIKELIIRGGVNLSPLEIDAVLAGHPAVRFAMAVPFENRYYGEEVAAYVVLREGHSPTEDLAEELGWYAAGRLPFPMQPKVVLFGSEVPYTTTGKPKRLALKALLAEQLLPYREVQFREGDRRGR